jgi:hypothetical protein
VRVYRLVKAVLSQPIRGYPYNLGVISRALGANLVFKESFKQKKKGQRTRQPPLLNEPVGGRLIGVMY